MLALSSHHSTRNLAIIDRGNGSYEPMDTRREPERSRRGWLLRPSLAALAIFAPGVGGRRHLLRMRRRALRCRSSVGPCADVLAQEMRWLTAITAGDVPAVESILSPTFKHVDSEGRLINRAEEIASMAAAAVHDEPDRPDRRHRGQHRGGPRCQHADPGRPGDWASRDSPTCSCCRTAGGWRCRRRRLPPDAVRNRNCEQICRQHQLHVCRLRDCSSLAL